MNIDHSELRTDRDSFTPTELRQAEREARRLRVELAGDHTAQLVVGLDLLIRRAAYAVLRVWRGVADRLAAVRGERGGMGRAALHGSSHGSSTLRPPSPY